MNLLKPDTLGVPGKAYLVGGAVRDKLMGREPKDLDYVIVGGNQAAMLAAGYHQVGADFPVFQHPVTNCEFSLARTERKAGLGYNGFIVETEGVELVDDLSRRDFTINAMAYDFDTDAVIDPFNGRDDLKDGFIRHVTTAFKDDPMRMLRAARFAARYNFKIADETKLAISQMPKEDLDALTPHRVMVEVQKAVPDFKWFLEMLHELKMGKVLKKVMFEFDPKWRYTLAQTDDKDALLVALYVFGIAHGCEVHEPFETTRSHHQVATHWTRHLLRSTSGASTIVESLVQLFDTVKGASMDLLIRAVKVTTLVNLGYDLERARTIYLSVKADMIAGNLEGPALGKAIRDARIGFLAQYLYAQKR